MTRSLPATSRIAGAAVMLLALLAPPAAIAQTSTDTVPPTTVPPTTVPSGADRALLAELIEQTTWVPPDGEIVVRFRLRDAPDDATVEVTVHEPLRDDRLGFFEDTLDRQRLGGRLLDPPLVLGTVGDLDPTASGVPITAIIPTRSGPQDPEQPERLGMSPSGIYPIDISVTGSDGERLGGLLTYIVRLPLPVADPHPTLGVVLVQPLPGDPGHLPDGTIDVDTATKSAWTLAIEALLTQPDQPVVVAVRPETLQALAASGSSLDTALVDQVASLSSSQLGVIPTTTFVDIDLDGALRANLDNELVDQLDSGDAAVTEHLGTPPDARLWIADSALTSTALAALSNRGISQIIVPHDALEDLDENGSPRTFAHPFRLVATDGSRVTALSTDPLLQSHAGSTGDPRLDAQRLLANLAVAWYEQPSLDRAVAIVLPVEPDPAFIETLRAGLATSPLVTVRTPADAIANARFATGESAVLTRELASSTSSVDLSDLRSEVNLARLSVASFATVFTDSDQRQADFHLLIAVSQSSAFDRGDRARYFGAIAAEMNGLFDAIDLPERRTITLPARDGTIPLALTNNSELDATILVRFDSDKLDFPGGDEVIVPLPAGTTTVEIDVRARASGAFPLNIEIHSPDGRREMATARYTVRSTAVSGLGLAISGAAIAVLAIWWVRTARRARAAHRADSVTATP